jgi:hypothetical protein
MLGSAMPRCFSRLISAALLFAPAAHAQHQHEPHADPEQAAEHQRHPVLPPHQRLGSGTSWLPDSSPMHMIAAKAGDWLLMFQGNLAAGYNHQASDRGDEQLTALAWLMAMASRPALGGELGLRVMLSPEPFLLPGDGYPLLLQTGETWQGEPLRDRQHPHDLFMELALIQQIPLSEEIGVELYLAPVGEPAIGPTAYQHRLSAMSDPLTPLGHHWQDSTHITYGVATAGLFGKVFKLEASYFNGHEPDEERTDFDFHTPDAIAARFSLNPVRSVSAQLSWASLPAHGGHHAERVQRATTSVAHVAELGSSGYWATTLVVGNNLRGHDKGPSFLVESNLDFDGRSVLYGRAELLYKSAEALVIEDAPEEERYRLASFGLGYQYGFGPIASLTPAIGARGSIALLPSALQPEYGTRAPVGGIVYAQIRPAAMRAGSFPH